MPRARTASLLLLLMWAIVAPVSSQRREPTSDAFTLSIVATTDLHGGVIQRGDRGGVALLGGYLRNLRAARRRDGGAVLLVDSGDMFQGTLESNLNEGAVVVRAYNELGYAAAAIGNHEFDYGPVGPDATAVKPGEDPRGALKARAAEAHFPFLAANIIDDATGQPVAWPNVKPSTLVTAGGVTIGLIGVTTLQTPVTTIADNIRGLTFAPMVPIVVKAATSLRSRGASVVVVLAHAGGSCTVLDSPEDGASCAPMSEILDLAHALPHGLVDVISAGHTHQAMAHDIDGIAVVEAYSGGRAFSRVDLTIARSSGRVTATHIFPPRDLCAREDPATHACGDVAALQKTRVPARYENRRVTPDAAAAAAIAPGIRRAQTVKNQTLGVFVETPIRVAAQTESALSDLFADGMLQSTAGAEVAVGNGGALRTDLPAGPLTYGEVYEVYPFDNRPVTISLTGDQLTRVVTYNLRRREAPTEILSIAGFRVDARCESGTLRVALSRPSGMPIRPDEKLTVVTPDFVAAGGEGLLAPAGAIDVRTVPGAPILHDLLADWLRRRGGRLNADQILSAANRRWSYPGQRPVGCS